MKTTREYKGEYKVESTAGTFYVELQEHLSDRPWFILTKDEDGRSEVSYDLSKTKRECIDKIKQWEGDSA